MSDVRDELRDADPLRHEPDAAGAARPRVRQAVLRASHASSTPRRPGGGVGGRRAAVLAVVVAVLAIGAGAWQLASPPVFAAVRFEVRLAEDTPSAGLREAPVGLQPRIVYVHDEIVASNDDVATCRVVPGRDGSRFGVEVTFSAAGAAKMRAATRNHIGRPVALLIDGLVVMAPVVRSEIGASATLSGDFGRDEAERIARGIGPRQ